MGLKKKIAVFLETKDQVISFLQGREIFEETVIFVALSPFSAYELEKNDISYTSLSHYHTTDELFSLSETNYRKLEQVCSFIDNFLSIHIKTINESGITPASFSIYGLKLMYDSVLGKYFQIKCFVEKERPDKIIAWKNHLNIHLESEDIPPFSFDIHESLFGTLIECMHFGPVAEMRDLTCETKTDRKKNRKSLTKIIKGIIRCHPQLADFIFSIRKVGPMATLKSFLHDVFCIKKKSIVFFGSGYNWNESYKIFLSNGFFLKYRFFDTSLDFRTKARENVMEEFWHILRNDSDFRKLLIEFDEDFFPLFENHFRELLESHVPQCIKAYRNADRFFSGKRIFAVFSSTFSTCTGHIFSFVARKYKVPVITWQHGGCGAFHDSGIPYNDLRSSDIHLIFGNGVYEYLKDSAIKHATTCIAVGSSSLESINMDRGPAVDSSSKIVLYITAPAFGNYLSLAIDPPIDDLLFWNTQKAILDVLGKHSGKFNVVVKEHPSNYLRSAPIREYWNDHGYMNCSFIKNERKLEDLIQSADIIIIDAPITTLLQSMMTECKIFVFLGHMKYFESARVLLGKRVVFDDNLDTFTAMLDRYFITGNYGADVNNKDFLHSFGLFSDDAPASHRVASLLASRSMRC